MTCICLFPIGIIEQTDDQGDSYDEVLEELASLISTIQGGKESPVYKAIEETYAKDLLVS